jgi:hypothetical protein
MNTKRHRGHPQHRRHIHDRRHHHHRMNQRQGGCARGLFGFQLDFDRQASQLYSTRHNSNRPNIHHRGSEFNWKNVMLVCSRPCCDVGNRENFTANFISLWIYYNRCQAEQRSKREAFHICGHHERPRDIKRHTCNRTVVPVKWENRAS